MTRFRAERVHLWLMLVLTFTTGINDAVGYLGLHRVFTGNMTGNVVVLGMALVGRTALPVAGPALALLGFMVGAFVTGRSLREVTEPWTARVTAVFGFVAAVMLASGVGLAILGEHPSRPEVVTTAAAIAMGAQAAAARHIGVKDVTTVVVTSTITGLAAELGIAPWRGGGTARRLVTIVLILLGAVLGALAWRWHLSAGFLVAGVLVAGVTTVGELHRRTAAAALVA